MDVPGVLWLAGEAVALAALGCGAVLSMFSSRFGSDEKAEYQSTAPPQFHSPHNHRHTAYSDANSDW